MLINVVNSTHTDYIILSTWCPGADSNHRHEDFQSSALPTELPGLLISYL